MQKLSGNPRYETQNKPRQPVSGISGTRYRLVWYEDGGLIVERKGHGYPIDRKELDRFLAQQFEKGKSNDEA